MRVLIRADASVGTGTGHIMRCLALAQALQKGGDEVQLAACHLPTSLEARLEENRIKLTRFQAEIGSDEDVKITLNLAKKPKVDAIVLDGYSFSCAYQKAIRTGRKGCFYFIDDGANLDGYTADILVNPNLYATEEMYEGQEIGKLLVG